MKVLKSLIKHLIVVHKHRKLVRKYCFKVGLYWQGLTHDLSKYSPTELISSVKYYSIHNGKKSPLDAERSEIGYSTAWLHHKGRNKHHFEYWTDYNSNRSATNKGEIIVYVEMPLCYIIEMWIDRMSASKTYKGEDYTDDSPLEYHRKNRNSVLLPEKTREILEDLLRINAIEGETEAVSYAKYLLALDKSNKNKIKNKLKETRSQ